MIRSLRIRNLATIEDLELQFKEGFSILTGETGAGKSIIIDGIRLLLGEKASPDLVRTGESEATIEAIFHMPEEEELPQDWPSLEERELLIQRRIQREGSGKSYLNGVLVPVKKLRELGPVVVDIYGQNDHVFLLQLESHLHFLDQFLGLASLREEVAGLARKVRLLLHEKEELAARKRDREQRLDFLAFQIKEIEAAKLKPGEWQDLTAERNILKNAEKIAILVEKALDIGYLQEDSALAQLGRLEDIVRELGVYDPALPGFGESLRQASITIRELADFLVRFRDRQNLGPERLEEVEARLSLLDRLKRKYGDSEEEILDYLGRARCEHEALLESEEKLAEIEAEVEAAFRDYRARAEELSGQRQGGAGALEKQMEKELGNLGMRRARFRVKIESRPPSLEEAEKIRETGFDEVEFLISPNPGEELRPLRKIASGGELSRIMLALKTTGKEKARLKTLIFDEIDSGVGGKTAECIAEKLRRLAERHQVICITHLPQIACFAPHHYRIDKSIERERTFTTVRELIFEERVEEISRLLAGSRVTAASLRTAEEMLLPHQEEKKKRKRGQDESRG
ncbi:MAG: DNA repair protein RecN [Candidatus Aminicenantes bacterium]|nr:DNA repair protein RecN [Candidatus Aminicenantes bacterium]